MTNGFGGLDDLRKMAAQAREHAEKLQANMQRERSGLVCHGEAGAGMVKVSIDGESKVRSVSIDPEVIDPEDRELLEDLVATATNQALEKLAAAQAEQQSEHLGSLGQQMGGLPGLGGVDFSKLFGG